MIIKVGNLSMEEFNSGNYSQYDKDFISSLEEVKRVTTLFDKFYSVTESVNVYREEYIQEVADELGMEAGIIGNTLSAVGNTASVAKSAVGLTTSAIKASVGLTAQGLQILKQILQQMQRMLNEFIKKSGEMMEDMMNKYARVRKNWENVASDIDKLRTLLPGIIFNDKLDLTFHRWDPKALRGYLGVLRDFNHFTDFLKEQYFTKKNFQWLSPEEVSGFLKERNYQEMANRIQVFGEGVSALRTLGQGAVAVALWTSDTSKDDFNRVRSSGIMDYIKKINNKRQLNNKASKETPTGGAFVKDSVLRNQVKRRYMPNDTGQRSQLVFDMYGSYDPNKGEGGYLGTLSDFVRSNALTSILSNNNVAKDTMTRQRRELDELLKQIGESAQEAINEGNAAANQSNNNQSNTNTSSTNQTSTNSQGENAFGDKPVDETGAESVLDKYFNEDFGNERAPERLDRNQNATRENTQTENHLSIARNYVGLYSNFITTVMNLFNGMTRDVASAAFVLLKEAEGILAVLKPLTEDGNWSNVKDPHKEDERGLGGFDSEDTTKIDDAFNNTTPIK